MLTLSKRSMIEIGQQNALLFHATMYMYFHIQYLGEKSIWRKTYLFMVSGAILDESYNPVLLL